MSGIIGRSGRRSTVMKKIMQGNFDDVAELTFREAYNLLRDQNIPLIDRVKVCLPLALKRIPDKHEVVQLTVNASPDDIAALMQLAQANLQLRQASHQVKVLSNDIYSIATAKHKAQTSTQPIDTQQVTASD